MKKSKKIVNYSRKYSKNVNKPLLSIGIIAKNEERCIEKCLKALMPLKNRLNCEIIIADTGSTDRTKEIAKKYADIVFDFKWIDDFSAARNAVIERSSADWYLTVDCDEYLDESSVDELAEFFLSDKHKKYKLGDIALYNYINNSNSGEYFVFFKPLLFKIADGIRFVNKIHERINVNSRANIYTFKNVIFWHDGYVEDVYTVKKKVDRNMTMLKKEIDENPEDYIKIMQAIESVIDKEEKIKYVRMFMSLLKKNTVEIQYLIIASVYRYALTLACEKNLHELEEWKETAYKYYGNSFFIRVDVNYALGVYEYKRNNYETAIEYFKNYLNAISELSKSGMEKIEDLRYSVIRKNTCEHIDLVKICFASCYFFLSEFEKAKEMLESCDMRKIETQNIEKWLQVAYLLWDKVDLTDLFSNIYELYYNDDDNYDKKEAFERETIVKFAYKYNEHVEHSEIMPKEPPYKLIANMGDCDVSYQARILMGDQNTTLDMISDWSMVSVVLWKKILEENYNLTDKFYDLDLGIIEGTANQIVLYIDETDVILNWIENLKDDARIKCNLFNLKLFLYIIKAKKWRNIKEKEKAFKSYIKYSEKVLYSIYNKDILCKEMMSVLHTNDAFCYLMIEYSKFFEQNCLKECMAILKKSFRLSPDMKDIIDYLMEIVNNNIKNCGMVQKEKAPKELLELAEKVKEILNSYSEDDPFVMSIKQSDVYQQVAYLIED